MKIFICEKIKLSMAGSLYGAAMYFKVETSFYFCHIYLQHDKLKYGRFGIHTQ